MSVTRLGKVVGSIKTDPGGWTYWPEKNWKTGEPGFVTVAPSGARFEWFLYEHSAREYVRTQNEEWFA